MHWLDAIKDYLHLGLGGVASVWIYKDKVDKMSFLERLIYVSLSIGIGFYGGNGISEYCGLDLGSSRARLITILLTIFGLALLGLARDNFSSVIERAKAKWL